MLILGIETSCDETGLALYDSEKGLLAHSVHSQIELHRQYGGVVPELASRDHIIKMIPTLNDVIKEADIKKTDIDAIAYTAGPGLIGALLVGASFAKSLSYSLNIPSIPIHHMEGHLLSPMLESSHPKFPFLALLVSGGHTLLVKVNNIGNYEILGESLDDAAGEAFDKTAKLLGLGYPGGPAISKLALQGKPGAYTFPRPMCNRPGLDFSFSGLKTHVLTTTQRDTNYIAADIAYELQEAITDVLVKKCARALKQTETSNLVISGGVSANKVLREKLENLMTKNNGKVYYPRLDLCTDNGAMIAYAGYMRAKQAKKDLKYEVHPRWKMEELIPIV